jgi:hypothetical protein
MPGIDKVATLTIAVRDQDEALQWFTEKLEFEKRTDISAPGMRWLTVAPKQQKEVEFVLASWFTDLVGKNAPCVVETQGCQRNVPDSQRPRRKVQSGADRKAIRHRGCV